MASLVEFDPSSRRNAALRGQRLMERATGYLKSLLARSLSRLRPVLVRERRYRDGFTPS